MYNKINKMSERCHKLPSSDKKFQINNNFVQIESYASLALNIVIKS